MYSRNTESVTLAKTFVTTHVCTIIHSGTKSKLNSGFNKCNRHIQMYQGDNKSESLFW